MIILLAGASDTAQNFFVGAPTKTLVSARWIKWSIAKADRSRFCSRKEVRFVRLLVAPSERL
jgi:hypothetical protein